MKNTRLMILVMCILAVVVGIIYTICVMNADIPVWMKLLLLKK